MAAKKISIRLIIYIFQGLIKLQKALIFLWSKIIIFFFRGLKKIVYQLGGRFLVLKFYSFCLLIKRAILKFYRPERNKILYHFTNRYIIHLVIILITLFITVDNIKAQTEIRTENFGSKSVLYSLVAERDEGVIEEIAIPQEQTANGKIKILSYLETEASIKAPLSQPGAIKEELFEENVATTVGGDSALIKPNINITHLADKLRTDTEYYTVQEGDTISEIAENFGVSVNTILWENNLKSWQYIKAGQKLAILPVSGLSHKVKKGENLNKIAKKYKIEADTILAFNELINADQIQVGQKLIIPEGEMPQALTPVRSNLQRLFIPSNANVPPGNKMFWPTDATRITQYFTWRHSGVDIAKSYNTPVYAAENGTVSLTGWGRGYGRQIDVDHGSGTKTRYAHLNKILVTKGQRVSKGQTIGLMGSSGWSTGPHLHFEVIVNGVKKNPLKYIR